ncbi:hypothetical protein Celaphus_00017938 [Cervus elaphus hippelaphus]|uniref:Uncharacterized protein n=1 Tax=Cervus elaphus hippelaphus TaxID=46360 RepID=A0A212C8K0_CEREH|nr:hypothetical protein Celaphus_00017938 [Cervus elaphus hippelaphus]
MCPLDKPGVENKWIPSAGSPVNLLHCSPTGPGSQTDVEVPLVLFGCGDVPFSSDEVIPSSMSSKSGSLGSNRPDYVTPEQIVCLKL